MFMSEKCAQMLKRTEGTSSMIFHLFFLQRKCWVNFSLIFLLSRCVLKGNNNNRRVTQLPSGHLYSMEDIEWEALKTVCIYNTYMDIPNTHTQIHLSFSTWLLRHCKPTAVWLCVLRITHFDVEQTKAALLTCIYPSQHKKTSVNDLEDEQHWAYNKRSLFFFFFSV